MYPRRLEPKIAALLARNPVVGLLGPRQVGKTTLAHALLEARLADGFQTLYLDLESEQDRARLHAPEEYLRRYEDRLVIFDEVQRMPGLFQVLRVLVDAGRRRGHRTGRFLILGSASLELIQQSAESLAGRIVYEELGPLDVLELPEGKERARKTEAIDLDRLWTRGGFPDSFLAADDAASLEWRRAFLRTYLERDVPQFGPRVPAETLRRLWTMLAHGQGTLLQASKLAAALGTSGQTIARYIDLLVDLLLVRRLPPWSSNLGKRLVRSPKLYVRDSGIAHALLGIRDLDALLGHPVAGLSWEGFVIENLLAVAPTGTEAHFYRTATGVELDLVLTLPDRSLWAVEIKRSSAPSLERGFAQACEDLKPKRRYVVYPGRERFPIGVDAEAIGLRELCTKLAGT
jgi:predicted AAA+ superfamily ATPase